jgi:hypothetical protein
VGREFCTRLAVPGLYIAWNGRMIDEWRIKRNIEGSRHDLNFPGEDDMLSLAAKYSI